jgi:hypothetical protein
MSSGVVRFGAAGGFSDPPPEEPDDPVASVATAQLATASQQKPSFCQAQLWKAMALACSPATRFTCG